MGQRNPNHQLIDGKHPSLSPDFLGLSTILFIGGKNVGNFADFAHPFGTSAVMKRSGIHRFCSS
jgi:hypothetical protein